MKTLIAGVAISNANLRRENIDKRLKQANEQTKREHLHKHSVNTDDRLTHRQSKKINSFKDNRPIDDTEIPRDKRRSLGKVEVKHRQTRG